MIVDSHQHFWDLDKLEYPWLVPDAILTGRQPATAGRENLGTVAVVAALYRSAEERRSVRLDEITGGAA